MTYRSSEALRRWQESRADVLRILAEAHAVTGNVSGRGRPLDVSKPLARAYVIAMVGEFQGFARDLHDLAVQRLLEGSGVDRRFMTVFTDGLSSGRALDRGNADLPAIKRDFARLGLIPLDLGTHDSRWLDGDAAEFPLIFKVRNALAHGNDREVRRLRTVGVQDTVTWAKRRVPVLNRVARSLDHLVWDHLHEIVVGEPWR